jgi:signal transduction histidine kinase
VRGSSESLALKSPHDTATRNLLLAVERLANEISVQRSLSHQKDGHYPTTIRAVRLAEIRSEVDLVLSGHHATRNRTIQTIGPGEDITIETDALLVSRVLGNMLINALEATPEGDFVKLTTITEPRHVVWHVWNESRIDGHIQKRIFQRHFSTKAQVGRGLGTYSMKLLGERYLRGEVTFTSDPGRGTTFTFRLPRAAESSPSRSATKR